MGDGCSTLDRKQLTVARSGEEPKFRVRLCAGGRWGGVCRVAAEPHLVLELPPGDIGCPAHEVPARCDRCDGCPSCRTRTEGGCV